MAYDQITLPNGLRIIGERIPSFRSVSVGLWVNAGSQYERPEEAGLSHFVEHMVFKGTAKRSTRRIAEDMDAVGGLLNAFTGKECTCFYAKVMDEHLPLAMDVLADLVTAPAFDPGELEKEKGVVIEEIAMVEDTPEDLVHELLMDAHYGDQPLARPILGTEEGIAACRREDLAGYWGRVYHPQATVLSVAGSYEWERVVELARSLLGGWPEEGFEPRTCVTVPAEPGLVCRDKDIEQIHMALGFPGLDISDAGNYALTLFNSVYGGAMSSRLFQKIREESGAAYSVYSYPNAYTDSGMLSVYAATGPENAEKVYGMILEETERLARGGMTRQEFEMGREQMKAGYVLGLESTSARMQSIGRRLLLLNTTRTETETLERIDAIGFEETNALMARLLTAPHSLSIVGRDAEKLGKKLFSR